MVGKFLRLPLGEKMLVAEAFVCLGTARLLVVTQPFKRISQLLGREGEAGAQVCDDKVVLQVKRAIAKVSRFTPWKSNCLAQSYAARWMLSRRNQPTVTYMGVARDPSGAMIAHSWTKAGDRFVTGERGSEGFVVTKVFGG